MKRVCLFALALLVLFALPASAQSAVQNRAAFDNTIIVQAYDHEKIAVAATHKELTAAKISPSDKTVKGEATWIFLSVETNSVYVCFDGTTATADDCHLIDKGKMIQVFGTSTLKQLSMIQGPDGASAVKVTYFRYRGK
jgi:hypothetical protein